MSPEVIPGCPSWLLLRIAVWRVDSQCGALLDLLGLLPLSIPAGSGSLSMKYNIVGEDDRAARRGGDGYEAAWFANGRHAQQRPFPGRVLT